MDDDSSTSVKENLQQRLLSSVKQCQKHYGISNDIATEGDVRVDSLCIEWESIVTHGLKKSKNLLRGFGKGTESNNVGVSMWPVISPLLSSEDHHRFMTLTNVNTDIGRGRAWLRAALNERTLENYFHSMLSNKPHLHNHYERHAFMLDDEKTALLPTMAAGLSSVIFSLSIDNGTLNSPDSKAASIRTSPSPIHAPSPTPNPTPNPVPMLSTLEAQPPTQSAFGSRVKDIYLKGNSGSHIDDDVVAVKKEKKKKSKKTKHTSSSQPPSLISDTESTYQTEVRRDSPSKIDAVPPTTDNPFDVPMKESQADTGNHDNLNPFNDTVSMTSTPSVNSLNSLGDDIIQSGTTLFNAPPIPNKSLNQDAMAMGSQAAIESTTMVLAATGEHQCTSNGTGTTDDKTMASTTTTTMSPNEMKEALKVLVRTKEEISECNQKLAQELEDERMTNIQLRENIERMKAEIAKTTESHTHQIQGLERENDLLREQLKRYVGIVKQHKEDDEQKDEQKDMAAKLSGMAELYGELMEFNDRLHKDVYTKNNVITTLCHTLLLAGLEIPVSSDQLPPEALQRKRIVEVRVPSVVKRDKGYYDYQIYLTLGNEEWNVYRRFAEFYEFHQQMLKSIEGVDEFPFPPKKAIGSKSTHVVEERRARLQEYLQFIIDACSKQVVKRKDGRVSKAILNSKISKEEFVRIFPFFKSDLTTSTDKSISNSGKQRAPFVKAPSYSGL